jgi:hypothetical protein
MVWIPIAAWSAAVMVALVLLGFCAYEISWKAKRLRGDLRQLQVVADRLAELRAGVAETQQRVAAAGLR